MFCDTNLSKFFYLHDLCNSPSAVICVYLIPLLDKRILRWLAMWVHRVRSYPVGRGYCLSWRRWTFPLSTISGNASYDMKRNHGKMELRLIWKRNSFFFLPLSLVQAVQTCLRTLLTCGRKIKSVLWRQILVLARKQFSTWERTQLCKGRQRIDGFYEQWKRAHRCFPKLVMLLPIYDFLLLAVGILWSLTLSAVRNKRPAQ